MKKTFYLLCFLSLFLLFTGVLRGQNDSTTLKLIYLNRELSLLNDLNNIQYTGFECRDSLAKGKRFLLLLEEYRDGHKIFSDTASLNCKEEVIPMNVGGKTMSYLYNPCERMSFLEEADSFIVALAGKLEGDRFKLLVSYPSMTMKKDLKGGSEYSLRSISCDADDNMRVPFNRLTPVFAYTPPFQTEQGMGSYCILGTEKVEDWYERFKVSHYYVISLLIE
ncbi:hypothetical protein [Porphyromonas macacae]|uniref:hypothetical protein n=1 Tax=Porphyromonas macacae TaxID=28115 RepID=UPI0024ACF861|nr:hypothetical protein [Porphyromonas macacae]